MGRKIATKNHSVWRTLDNANWAHLGDLKELQAAVIAAKALEWLKVTIPSIYKNYAEARAVADQIKVMYDTAPAEIKEMLSLTCHNVSSRKGSLQDYVPPVVYRSLEEAVFAEFEPRFQAIKVAYDRARDAVDAAETEADLVTIVADFQHLSF